MEGEPEWVPDGKVSFETQSKVRPTSNTSHGCSI